MSPAPEATADIDPQSVIASSTACLWDKTGHTCFMTSTAISGDLFRRSTE
jgi:hypothetical protein